MSWTTIKDGIYDWLKTILASETVVWEKQNVGQPPKPYVVLGVDSFLQIGEDYVSRAHIFGNRDFTLKIQYFGSGAIDRLEAIRIATQNPLSLETLRAAGFIFVDSEAIMELTELDQNNYEERAAMDLHLRAASDLSISVGSVTAIGMQKRFTLTGADYQSGTAIMIENITIP
jgi:hypothetical protein